MDHLLNCIHDKLPLNPAEKKLDTPVCLGKCLRVENHFKALFLVATE